MNYLAQAKITEDDYIIQRVKACAAGQGVPDPHTWVMTNIWTLSAQPGWGEAYAPSLTVEATQDPAAWAGSAGADPSIITDQMILDAVQDVLSKEVAPDAN